MRDLIKDILKKIGPSFLFYKKSYAQEGEDLVVNRLLMGKKAGFYVEVGAHHPYRFSNTYFFYKRGWSGVCIDPLPGTKRRFTCARPRDTAIELGVSIKPGVLKYYMFNEPALNTFDQLIAKDRDGKNGYRIIKTRDIEIKTMSAILANIDIPKTGIDLLSVDVEGLDYDVLSSMDWNKYRPRIVICECLGFSFDSSPRDPVFRLLTNIGYEFYAKTGHSMIFSLKE